MNITGYKVIYKNVLYKCLMVEVPPYPEREPDVGITKAKGMMGILVINEDGDLKAYFRVASEKRKGAYSLYFSTSPVEFVEVVE